MKRVIKTVLLTIATKYGFSQSFYKEYFTNKALYNITAEIKFEQAILDFDENGSPIFGWVEQVPFNAGVNPVLMDSVAFLLRRWAFINDSNFVFGELKIVDFDNPHCYECDSLINPNYEYEFTPYRYFYGEPADEASIKNEKFVYYFVGQTPRGINYIHLLMGIEREF